MKLSRRIFTSNLVRSLPTFSLVKSLEKRAVLAGPVSPIVRTWLIEIEDMTRDVRQGSVKPIDWQKQIELLRFRLELKDLLSAIDYDRLAKTAVLPQDHELIERIAFSQTPDLPRQLSFAPYFYGMKKGVAIAVMKIKEKRWQMWRAYLEHVEFVVPLFVEYRQFYGQHSDAVGGFASEGFLPHRDGLCRKNH